MLSVVPSHDVECLREITSKFDLSILNKDIHINHTKKDRLRTPEKKTELLSKILNYLKQNLIKFYL